MTVARTRVRWVALALAAGLSLAGCGLVGDDDPAPTTTTTRRATTTTTTVATPEPEVIDPGAEPRRAVRFTFTPGATSTIAITSDLTVTQEASGRSQTLDSPAITEVVTFTTGRRTAEGAAISFRFDEVTLDPAGSALTEAEQADLTEQLTALEGVGGTGTVTDLGAFEDFRYELPAGLDPTLARQLRELESQLQGAAVLLPEAPIGAGASWRTVQSIRASGIEVAQTTTYRLTELGATSLGYTAAIIQDAEPQPVELDSLPEGITARLTSSRATGTLLGTTALDRVSTDVTGSITGDQRLTLDGDGSGPLIVRQHLVSTLTIRPEG